MFLETTPEGKIYKELAADHFADPKGLGKYALFLRPSQGDLIPAPQPAPLRPVPAHHPGGTQPLCHPGLLRLFQAPGGDGH